MGTQNFVAAPPHPPHPPPRTAATGRLGRQLGDPAFQRSSVGFQAGVRPTQVLQVALQLFGERPRVGCLSAGRVQLGAAGICDSWDSVRDAGVEGLGKGWPGMVNGELRAGECDPPSHRRRPPLPPPHPPV